MVLYRQYNSPERFKAYFDEKLTASNKSVYIMDGFNINLLLCSGLVTFSAPTIDKPTRVHKNSATFKGAVSGNSAKLGNYKMPVKLRET